MKKQPIFTKILIPLMGLVILEILILMISIYGQGLFSLIHKNSQRYHRKSCGSKTKLSGKPDGESVDECQPNRAKD